MGKWAKSSKKKKKNRVHPYKRRNEDGDSMDEEEEAKPETRGQMLQRHKREWKAMRAELAALDRESKMYSRKDPMQKAEKKGIRQDMMRRKAAVLEQQAEELALFDEEKTQKLELQTMFAPLPA
eukprot:gene11663-2120_t